ncbi:hypothetical protein BKA60DRAFT_531640 [Fusarium oxysporum]|nr:hypothetical protein BKA60DRAFT_531640 [Fusarium oxysporum]
MQSAIIWPTKFLPGTTDNYVSNEVIVRDITAAQIWTYLADITQWESYYNNCSHITPPVGGNNLKKGDSFSFSTFGFPPFPAEVMESLPPSAGSPGRLAWRAWVDGDESSKLDVYHAWIVEDLEYGVVRILTQESQIGQPAAKLAATKPNPMLNGHQEWLDSLKLPLDSVLHNAIAFFQCMLGVKCNGVVWERRASIKRLQCIIMPRRAAYHGALATRSFPANPFNHHDLGVTYDQISLRSSSPSLAWSINGLCA